MGVIIGFLGMVLFGLVIRLLGVEIGAHHMPLCRWLVRAAAARLPVDERAAAESEWLAVIGDLSSPTRQLLHSLSYTFSALRIRHAIESETQTYVRRSIITVLTLQAATMVGGLVVALTLKLDTQAGEAIRVLDQYVHISKPVAIVALLLLTIVTAYVNFYAVVWMANYRARRRARLGIE